MKPKPSFHSLALRTFCVYILVCFHHSVNGSEWKPSSIQYNPMDYEYIQTTVSGDDTTALFKEFYKAMMAERLLNTRDATQNRNNFRNVLGCPFRQQKFSLGDKVNGIKNYKPTDIKLWPDTSKRSEDGKHRFRGNPKALFKPKARVSRLAFESSIPEIKQYILEHVFTSDEKIPAGLLNI